MDGWCQPGLIRGHPRAQHGIGSTAVGDIRDFRFGGPCAGHPIDLEDGTALKAGLQLARLQHGIQVLQVTPHHVAKRLLIFEDRFATHGTLWNAGIAACRQVALGFQVVFDKDF